MLKIESIKLLRGCHEHTGQTGQGCFLNVCSYLQGDAVITDKPSSVHGGLRQGLIGLNDFAPSDEQRQRLIPFVQRAMMTGGKSDMTLALGGRFLLELVSECTRMGHRCMPQVNYDSALGFLDALLPRDEEPTVEMARRAADLAIARAAWGDKPTPKPKADPFSSIQSYHSAMLDIEKAIIQGLKMKFVGGTPEMAIADEMSFFDLWPSPSIAPKPLALKPNKPHGPIKAHKPAYF